MTSSTTSIAPTARYRSRSQRATDAELLGAKLVPLRRPGQWASAAVALVLFAMLVHTLITNNRFQWGIVGEYFTDRLDHARPGC